MLKPESFYAEHGVELRLGVRAVAIDRAARQVRDREAAKRSPMTSSSSPRARGRGGWTIPGADLDGLLCAAHRRATPRQLKAALGPGKRIAVVGGGYIGLEAAASARALGAEVVVIERETRLLARTACERRCRTSSKTIIAIARRHLRTGRRDGLASRATAGTSPV